ncbi:MAG: hypothetical protein ACRD3N_13740 [Terracidiphilus sp.]
MESTLAAVPRQSGAVLRAIFWGGLLCGAIDIAVAFVVYWPFGARPIPLLQGIAAGALGRNAYRGGLPTAALGLFFQFLIAYGAAAVYVLASRVRVFLARRPLIAGPLYGIAVYWFMQIAVLPFSSTIKRPFSLELTVVGMAIHIFTVGLTIALTTKHFAPL